MRKNLRLFLMSLSWYAMLGLGLAMTSTITLAGQVEQYIQNFYYSPPQLADFSARSAGAKFFDILAFKMIINVREKIVPNRQPGELK